METERLIELVVMARQGDEKAMETLYLDAKRSVYHLALRMVKNPEDAEDITQEVFITVHEKISTLREPAAFYKWLNQITASKCTDLLRKYKGISKLNDEDEFLALADDDPLNLPDKAIDDEDTRKIILEVIDNLPDGQRVCIILYYYQQNTIAQISDMLEINENTVKSRLALARAKIRAALEEKEKKEGIKLYGIPLALTPILRQAAQDFVMPEDVSARIWGNVKKAVSEGTPGSGGNGDKRPGTSGADTAEKGISIAAKIATLSTGVKVGIIAVIVAAVIAAVGITVYLRQQDTPKEPPAEQVTDGSTGTADSIDNSPMPEDSNNAEDENVTGQSAPVETVVSGADLKEVMRAYQKILEINESAISTSWYNVCILDICGDETPELLYVCDVSDDKRELHIWTYKGEAKEILIETVKDRGSEFGAIDFDVITTNDGDLFIRQVSSGPDWYYDIYFRYAYDENTQKYNGYSTTSNSVLKYITGLEVFDGYYTNGWDDMETFNEQVDAILSEMKNYLFSSNIGQSSSYMANAKQVFFYDDAINYIDKMKRGNIE